MKKLSKILENQMKKSVERTLQSDANSATCVIIYQPKAPAELKKFSKVK